MRYLRVIATTTAICILSPAAAQGQVSRPDPNSPAGVEYQLPLDQARKNAAGQGDAKPTRGRGGAASKAPLFGAGIKTASAGRDGRGGSSASGGSGASSSGEARDGSRAASGSSGGSDEGGPVGGSLGSSQPDVRKSAVVAESGDGLGTLRIVGIAFGVLLLGGLLGLGLRRGLGQQPRA
jgi:hypothetical protein